METTLKCNQDCKGMGSFPDNYPISKISELKWNILNEDTSLPVAVLNLKKMNQNLSWMQEFVEQYGAKFAPHGKTSMSPSLFQRQVATGSCGISLASATQTKVAHSFGVPQVLMVNILVGKKNMNIISEIITIDPVFKFLCLVDSAANVEQLGTFFSQRNQKLRVMLEIGVITEGKILGRTGVRNLEQEKSVLEALKKWSDCILLVGVEFFEGLLHTEDQVRSFIKRAVTRSEYMVSMKCFAESPIILSGAGSCWFDIVAEELSMAASKFKAMSIPVEVVLRPGCYLTHGVSMYDQCEKRIKAKNTVAKKIGTTLTPALQIWAYVISLPEPGLAIIEMGKRDVAFDYDYPVPALIYRPGSCESDWKKPKIINENLSAEVVCEKKWKIIHMMDQHVFMKVGKGDDIKIGDMIAFDISHPCTTFDKWRNILVVDENSTVVDCLRTYF